MRRLVLLIFTLTPGLAMAAPLVVWLGTEVIVGIGITWGTVIFTAATVVYGQAQQRKQKKEQSRQAQEARNNFNANLRDRTVTGVATEFTYRAIYGRARVGGNVVAIFKSGARDEYKHLIVQIAPHLCDEIEEIFIGNTPVGQLDLYGMATAGIFFKSEVFSKTENFVNDGSAMILAFPPTEGTVTVIGERTTERDYFNYYNTEQVPLDFFMVASQVIINTPGFSRITVNYQYVLKTSAVRITKHLGGMYDPADAQTVNDTGGVWNNDCVLRGHTYLAIRLNLNQPEFQNGLPGIEVIVRGKRLYDPRNGAIEWSENNALVAYDYLTSELGGLQASDLPLGSYMSAANDCDDFIVTGGWSGPRYRFNGVINSDQAREDVLEKIAQSMAGGIDATNWVIFAGKYTAPIMAILQSDVVGDIAISPGQAQNDIYNTVKGQYIGADRDYVANDYKPYQNAALLAVDGAELVTNIDFPYTNHQQRVTNLARIYTEQNRNAFSITARFSLKTWRLNVGERITLTMPIFGFAAKVFRVTDKKFTREQLIELGLKEDAPEIYDLADQTVADATPNTNLPNPFVIGLMQNLVCESGTNVLMIQDDGSIVSRIKVSWDFFPTAGIIEIESLRINNASWIKTNAPGDATNAFISPVADKGFYQVRARAASIYFNTRGPWAYAALHRVVGKTEPPPDVQTLSIAGLLLSWPAVLALDLAGYLLRFQYGTYLDWGSATPLHTGVLTGSPHLLRARPSGVVTIMVKAVDTSGNVSVHAAVVIENLGGAPIANVTEVFNFRALSTPPNLSNQLLAAGRYPYTPDQLQSYSRLSLATYFDEVGVLRTAAINSPRVTYDPFTHALLGLLIEDAGNNAIIYSNNFAAAAWSRAVNVTDNAAAAPDGTFTASKIGTIPGAPNGSFIETVVASAPLGQFNTASVFCKGGAGVDQVYLEFDGANKGANFDLTTGAVSLVLGNATYFVQRLSDGFWRFNLTAPATTADFVYFRIWVADSKGGGPTRTALPGDDRGFYLFGAQINNGNSDTSHIATNGAAATRAKDNAVLSAAVGFPGQWSVNGSVTGGRFEAGIVVANSTNSFYGDAKQSFYDASGQDPFYALENYSPMRYTSAAITVAKVLEGSMMTLDVNATGVDLKMFYRLSGPDSFYGQAGTDSFYGQTGNGSFYGLPGAYGPWPGQISAAAQVYEFAIDLGGGAVQGRIMQAALIVDAPDLVEYLQDIVIPAGGVAIPYVKNFSAIKTITTSLQANLSGVETIETDKTINLAPRVKAFNSNHASIGGATADFIIKGY